PAAAHRQAVEDVATQSVRPVVGPARLEGLAGGGAALHVIVARRPQPPVGATTQPTVIGEPAKEAEGVLGKVPAEEVAIAGEDNPAPQRRGGQLVTWRGMSTPRLPSWSEWQTARKGPERDLVGEVYPGIACHAGESLAVRREGH